jgi:hypothetical protein
MTGISGKDASHDGRRGSDGEGRSRDKRLAPRVGSAPPRRAHGRLFVWRRAPERGYFRNGYCSGAKAQNRL